MRQTISVNSSFSSGFRSSEMASNSLAAAPQRFSASAKEGAGGGVLASERRPSSAMAAATRRRSSGTNAMTSPSRRTPSALTCGAMARNSSAVMRVSCAAWKKAGPNSSRWRMHLPAAGADLFGPELVPVAGLAQVHPFVTNAAKALDVSGGAASGDQSKGLAASQPLAQFEVPRRRWAGGGRLLLQRVVHVVIREDLGDSPKPRLNTKGLGAVFGAIRPNVLPLRSQVSRGPSPNRFSGTHFSRHPPDANVFKNFAKWRDRKTASYRSLGVRPVFLARTFMAVGPRVTLSW